MVGLKFSDELESILTPYRAEYRRIVKEWIESGTFGSSYPAFLVETFHQAKHSSSLMDYARARLDPNRPEVQAYLARHADEELGHEDWALDDLEHLGIDRGRPLLSSRLRAVFCR